MKLKVCGISRLNEVSVLNELLPDYVGFVFAPASSRYVSFEQAAQLRSALDPRITTVGVFVSSSPEEIAELLKSGTISSVQLHGQQDEDFVRALQEELKGEDTQIIYALPAGSPITPAAVRADFLLFDYPHAGSGKSFDWEQIPGTGTDFFLAGGIGEHNLTEALKTKAYALDLSSSLETDGLKDPSKIASFIKKFRQEIAMNDAHFGSFGGQYVPETLMYAIEELREAYEHYIKDPEFQAELEELLANYAGRPSLLYHAKNISDEIGGAQIYLKREDLNHTGSHKINNVLGQALLAKRMGKKRIIAETGAGQHGVAAATAAALLGLECEVFMGKEDTIRQALNVYRMKLLGAEVRAVTSGTMTLKDAVNEAMREWALRVEDSFYVLGSVMGPHPYPKMVRDFQAVIGRELKEQMLEAEAQLPDAIVACVGGGSNAIGSFYDFIEDHAVRLIGCEAAGKGLDTNEHAATLSKGSVGILHGMKSLFCQDEFGQISPVYSISAGLDYPGIGPEHAHLHDIGRAEYVAVTDTQAVAAFERLSRSEGIIPAIESAHALSYAFELAASMRPDQIVAVCLSGRGDKDVAAIARYKGEDMHE